MCVNVHVLVCACVCASVFVCVRACFCVRAPGYKKHTAP